MKIYNFKEEPIKIFGIPNWEQTKKLQRLPDDLLQILNDKLPYFPRVGQRCPGARLCFKTDSTEFVVKIAMEELTPDLGMSPFACQSAHVLIGERSKARFAGLAAPEGYENKVFEKKFYKNNEMEDITIFLPVADVIASVEIAINDDAKIEAPTPYKYSMPIVYYGSSITEGACCSRPSNAYSALISNWLDVDYYNLGFSGGAKGNLEVADYINTIKMGIFVMDYDHNAPSADYLQATHEPFFRRIREKNPDLPIVMMTSPDFDYAEDKKIRREIVKKTYKNAVKEGDQNVYFIDGETFFGTEDRHCCTIDICHPNDLGAYRMAKVIRPVIQEILEHTGK